MDMKEIEKYLIAVLIIAVAIGLVYLISPTTITGILQPKSVNFTIVYNGSLIVVPLDVNELKGTGKNITVGDMTYFILIGNTELSDSPLNKSLLDSSVKLRQCKNLLFVGGAQDMYSFASTQNNGTTRFDSVSSMDGKESTTLIQPKITPTATVVASNDSPSTSQRPIQSINASSASTEYLVWKTDTTVIINASNTIIYGNLTRKTYLNEKDLSCFVQIEDGNIGKKRISNVIECENSLPRYNPYTVCADDLKFVRNEDITVPAGTFDTSVYVTEDGTTYWASNLSVPIRIKTNTSNIELVKYEKR